MLRIIVQKRGDFVGMAKYTVFGLAVKNKLLELPNTQAWLASEVSAKSGLKVDSAYLSKILTGKRSSPRVRQAVCDLLGLSDAPTA